MRNRYDIIIVGAGPAGSTAARYAAASGASVLLLEKDRDIGIPVRCAEGVSRKGLLASVKEIKDRWIANETNGVIFHAPNGNQVELHTETGYILDRKIFDFDLAREAASQGACILTKAHVYDVIKKDQQVIGVKMNYLHESYDVYADIVIGADGVESRIGTWAGLTTRCKLSDMETCVQVTASNVNIRKENIHLYFSASRAPQGYLWAFPKGNGLANVGLGISGKMASEKSPVDYLQEFLQTDFPNASRLTTVAGGVPCDKTLDKIFADGLMLVGDAAHQANPISGGGISSGMYAGMLAGQVAGKAIKEKDVSAKRLAEYGQLWHKKEGRNHKMCYNLKNYVYNLTDPELDEIAEKALKINKEKRTLLMLFRAALVKKPSLIMQALKVFS